MFSHLGTYQAWFALYYIIFWLTMEGRWPYLFHYCLSCIIDTVTTNGLLVFVTCQEVIAIDVYFLPTEAGGCECSGKETYLDLGIEGCIKYFVVHWVLLIGS